MNVINNKLDNKLTLCKKNKKKFSLQIILENILYTIDRFSFYKLFNLTIRDLDIFHDIAIGNKTVELRMVSKTISKIRVNDIITITCCNCDYPIYVKITKCTPETMLDKLLSNNDILQKSLPNRVSNVSSGLKICKKYYGDKVNNKKFIGLFLSKIN